MENFTSNKVGIWFDFKIQPENEWMKFFDKLENANISECFINANVNQLDYLISLTKNYNLNIHGWIWTLNRPYDEKCSKNLDATTLLKLTQVQPALRL